MTRQTLFVWLLLAASLPAAAQAVLVLPLEDHSRTSDQAHTSAWIGESAAEGIAAHFRGTAGSETTFAIRREERLAAFDQLGLPPTVSLSHATVIKIAELTGADIVITGSFTTSFTPDDARAPGFVELSASLLDMRRPHLGPVRVEHGPLSDLLALQERLAAALAASVGIAPSASGPGPASGTASETAWESYIRGLIAGPLPEQAKYFREAVRLDPGFMAPAFRLGRIAFQTQDYAGALLWLDKPGPQDANYLEATFFLGLAACHLRDWEKAETAFRRVAEALPLDEAYNNLGVVEVRQRKRAAVEHFQKSVEGDPNDADYTFNLGVYYLRNSDFPQAARYLRESLAAKPGDPEARALLSHTLAGNSSGDPGITERLKANFDEPSFRQFRMTLRRAEEDKLQTLPLADHAASHVARGREHFDRGDDASAIAEFREAVKVRPGDAQAFLYLAQAYFRSVRIDDAIDAARRSADLDKKEAGALILLARIYKDQGKPGEARNAIREALDRDPNNSAALELERGLKAKLP